MVGSDRHVSSVSSLPGPVIHKPSPTEAATRAAWGPNADTTMGTGSGGRSKIRAFSTV